jgi:hypothetical protein
VRQNDDVGLPCKAVTEEDDMVGDIGAVEEEDVDEEICSWKVSRSFLRAFACFNAWL